MYKYNRIAYGIIKAPIFRCFFSLFTAIYGDFTCFSHIDKTTAHGLFRTPIFHFSIVFCSLCATQFTQSVWYIIKKHQILQLLLSNSHYIPSLVFFAIVSIWIPFSCKDTFRFALNFWASLFSFSLIYWLTP